MRRTRGKINQIIAHASSAAHSVNGCAHTVRLAYGYGVRVKRRDGQIAHVHVHQTEHLHLIIDVEGVDSFPAILLFSEMTGRGKASGGNERGSVKAATRNGNRVSGRDVAVCVEACADGHTLERARV